MAEHWYNQKGQLVPSGTPKAVPSVTTIIDVLDKPELHAWQMKVGIKASIKKQQESAARGTAIHQLVSDWITGKAVEPTNTDQERMLDGYINWADKANPTEVESEIFVRSKAYGYAGTVDIICRLDGCLWIIDLKTSKAFHPTYGLQLRAYEQAIFEARGEHARTAIVQLTDQVKPCFRFKEYDEPLDVFLAMKLVFEWNKSHKRGVVDAWDGKYITD